MVEIGEVALAALLERVRDAQLQRPARPRRDLVGARARRLADELDLRDRRGALAVRVRDAVGARVAAADHDDVLAGGGDHVVALGRGRRAGHPAAELAGHEAVALVEVVHREVHARQLAARAPAGRAARASRSRSRPRRSSARSSPASTSLADVDAEAELDALGRELLDAALDDASSRS